MKVQCNELKFWKINKLNWSQYFFIDLNQICGSHHQGRFLHQWAVHSIKLSKIRLKLITKRGNWTDFESNYYNHLSNRYTHSFSVRVYHHFVLCIHSSYQNHAMNKIAVCPSGHRRYLLFWYSILLRKHCYMIVVSDLYLQHWTVRYNLYSMSYYIDSSQWRALVWARKERWMYQ